MHGVHSGLSCFSLSVVHPHLTVQATARAVSSEATERPGVTCGI